ncbi:MAG: hypothetical protein ACLPXT_10885 [Terracidiphilus sp.]
MRAFQLAHTAHLLVHGQAGKYYPTAQAYGPAIAPARGGPLAAHAGLRRQLSFHGLIISVFAAFKIESSEQKSIITTPMCAQSSYIHS